MFVQDPPVQPTIDLQPAADQSGRATVLVTGAAGLLGSVLVPELNRQGAQVCCHFRTKPLGAGSASLGFSLEKTELIEPAIRAVRPDWIIHAAANTNLDDCENDAVTARNLHLTASFELARAAAVHGCRLLYVSTDSVYDGERPGAHGEEDETKPINQYAATKREGELACLEALPSTIVARVNFFGLQADRSLGLAGWILQTLRAGRPLQGFTDVRFNPLLNHDLAMLLGEMTTRNLPGGIYNVGAADSCSKYEFARNIARLIEVEERLVLPAELADAHLRTARPRNTVMNTAKLAAALDHPLPTIADGLRRLFTSTAPAPA